MKLIRNATRKDLLDENENLVRNLENIEIRIVKRLTTKDGFLQASKNLRIGQSILIDKGTAQFQTFKDANGIERQYEVVSQVDVHGKPLINAAGESISWLPVDFISE